MVIDLKVGRFSYADAGQIHLYLNYACEHWTKPSETGENRIRSLSFRSSLNWRASRKVALDCVFGTGRGLFAFTECELGENRDEWSSEFSAFGASRSFSGASPSAVNVEILMIVLTVATGTLAAICKNADDGKS